MLHTYNFQTASKACLEYLQKKFGFQLWMVTRTEGDDWIVLDSVDKGYGVIPGAVFKWTDSFCSEMVKGNGPRIAPQSNLVPAYLNAPIGQQVPIKAYVGIPLNKPDGSLFGTLCAIDPEPKEEAILEHQDTIELIASMLNAILCNELQFEEEKRVSELLAKVAHLDALTQIPNRRAWDQFITKEEERCRRYGHSAAVIVIDLDNLKQMNDTMGHAKGDELIIKASQLITQIARESDMVARLGGDEFGIIAVECNMSGGEALVNRLRKTFDDANIQASFGISIRNPAKNIIAAWDDADKAMFADKKRKAESSATQALANIA